MLEGFSIPLLGIYANFLQWLEGMELPCPSRKFLHIECPGCGLQRSMMALLRGEWVQSWTYYPALVPIILLVVFALVHLRKKFKFGHLAIRYGQVFVVVLIAGNYIYKIINHKIFV